MSAADRELLADMGREHATAMLKQVGAIETALAPMLTALGGSASEVRGGAHAGASGGPWQTAAESAFRTARRVEVLLSVVLGVTSGDGPAANLPSDLLSALKQLEAELEDCQRLLSRNAGG
jgi:hypothetical protein